MEGLITMIFIVAVVILILGLADDLDARKKLSWVAKELLVEEVPKGYLSVELCSYYERCLLAKVSSIKEKISSIKSSLGNADSSAKVQELGTELHKNMNLLQAISQVVPYLKNKNGWW